MLNSNEFESFFTDKSLSEAQSSALKKLRDLIHSLYPEVQEAVVDAMPGFFPKKATQPEQMLFFFQAQADYFLILGIDGLEADDFKFFSRFGVLYQTDKQALQVPFELPDKQLQELLQFVMKYNFERHGVDLMH